ncbi:hypothetical protein ambt_21125 [Alteromonas naphthalenivorans]|uniref:Uncharacterized protein n=1 Tax=Alteromonas naphthalenivorans TaxID=715451 RepID=F5Z753_ALTNA|nr:hypothetical protein ambt_21125 [Alteromonas naphthalenivorans]
MDHDWVLRIAGFITIEGVTKEDEARMHTHSSLIFISLPTGGVQPGKHLFR